MLQLLLSISLSQIADIERQLTSSTSPYKEDNISVLADLQTSEEEEIHLVPRKPLFHGFFRQKSHHCSDWLSYKFVEGGKWLLLVGEHL